VQINHFKNLKKYLKYKKKYLDLKIKLNKDKSK
jgi:hypothetical protein